MEETSAQQTEQQQSQYFGKYRGFVVNNEDPDMRGRLMLRVPALFGENITSWALPCMPFGGLAQQGIFMIPEVGAQVWVEFEAGDLDLPIWTGVFWQQQSDVPQEASAAEPTKRIIKTVSGHFLLFDDTEDTEKITLQHSTGSKLDIDEEGTVTLSDTQGAVLKMDASSNEVTMEDASGNKLTMNSSGTLVEDSNGNRIEMAAAGITVQGQLVTIDASRIEIGGAGGEPLIKGQSFLSLFATHMHTCTAPGSPTSPPIPQGEMSTLTMKTTAS